MFTFFDFSDIYTEWYWVLVVVAVYIGVLIGAAIIVSKIRGESLKFSSRDLTYGGVCIAISFTLSIVGVIHKMPYGGSITLFSVVPILIYCYYFGFSKGMLVSIVFMLLQFVDGPYIIHPFSALLDYLVPYSALAFAGLFSYKYGGKAKNSLKSHWGIFLGASLYFVVRYTSHVLAGVVFWYDADAVIWQGFGPIVYSLLYNISYCLPDFLIALIGVGALCLSKQFNSYMTSQAAQIKRSNALN